MTKTRSDLFHKIREADGFDAVVIGGGVNGIGVYRDLALQGLRVLLVEKNDFCSGCSAAPSRMIHGGLRYLENGEFDLVKESLQERDALLTNAPHMVRPLPTVIPISSVFSGMFNAAASFVGLKGKPSARGVLPIKMGLSLYDLVTRKRRLTPTHQMFGRRRTRQDWPTLSKEAKYSAVFYDAWISHPERLCIELLKDISAATSDAYALNYATLRLESGTHILADNVSGDEIEIKTKVIVNASGAWLDDVARDLSSVSADRMVSGTKGSHLILDHPDLYKALKGHMVYFENDDGRVCIVFPYLGRVLAGSTDIRVEKAKRVRCEPEEQSYILESLNMVFDGLRVTDEHVVFSYSGIRPLPKSDADFTGRISRGHHVKRLEGDVPQFCMIGGKWTTFRAFGEQTSDAVLAEIGKERIISTLERPIGGGAGFADLGANLETSLMARHGVSKQRAKHLIDHYGSHAHEVQEVCDQLASDAPIADGTEYTTAEIAYLIQTEFALTVADIVLRRTSLAIRGQLNGAILDRITEILADALHLSSEAAVGQRQALVDELVTYHGVAADGLTHALNNRSTQCA
ncbi:MAG: glycerol-3-phosphate dehydrogenase/oxidase [Pseudomonadota bacterium]|nr:glycerol-3-phosphate dehydrogenase/oxidase [Pseudomonadota bacterium]